MDTTVEKNEQLVRFGQLVRERRKSMKLTEEKLAELVELSDRALRDIENGVTDPHISNVLRICEQCNIDAGELL